MSKCMVISYWVLFAIIACTALLIVCKRYDSRDVFTKLEKQRDEYDVLKLEAVRLVNELSVFLDNGRIDTIARKQLYMHNPADESVVYVKK